MRITTSLNRFMALSLLSAAVGSSAWAIPFDNSAGGPAVATVNAGGGADYTSFKAACDAFNAVVGDINRPWTMEIQSDLVVGTTEIPSLANTFGAGGSLTIKPAAATTPKITFQYTTPSPLGFFGLFVIGSNSIAAAPTLDSHIPETDGKYTIDGSNTVGGTTRDLTFAAGETTAIAGNLNRLIRIVGRTDGVVIKNINVIHNDTAGSVEGIALGAGSVGATAFAPDNCTIQNCFISVGNLAGTSANGFGIGTTNAANGTLPSGTAIQGLTVTGCTIVAKQRGVFMNAVGDATITNNTMSIVSPGNTITNLVFHLNSNNDLAYTQEISGNVLTATGAGTTAGNGVVAIFLDSGSLGAVGTYNVRNNIVLGLANTVAGDALVRGISGANVTSNYNIEHNTVVVLDSSATSATANRIYGIGTPVTFTTGSMVVRNNFVRIAEPIGSAAGLVFAGTTGVTSVGNCVFPDAGCRFGRASGVDYADLAAWQVGFPAFDTTASGAQSVDLTATTPSAINITTGKWSGTGKPVGVVSTASSTVLTDIDGDTRTSGLAYAGADEFAAFPLPVELTGFSIE